jgi:hypothetical protein
VHVRCAASPTQLHAAAAAPQQQPQQQPQQPDCPEPNREAAHQQPQAQQQPAPAGGRHAFLLVEQPGEPGGAVIVDPEFASHFALPADSRYQKVLAAVPRLLVMQVGGGARVGAGERGVSAWAWVRGRMAAHACARGRAQHGARSTHRRRRACSS